MAVAGFGVAAFKAGQEMDAVFDTIVIKTGATGETLETLKEDFKQGTIAGDVNFAGTTGRSLVQNDYIELLLQFDKDATRTVFHNPFSQFGMFSLIR